MPTERPHDRPRKYIVQNSGPDQKSGPRPPGPVIIDYLTTAEERMQDTEIRLCIICAWRQTCGKQFSMKAGQKCPDYSRDVTIKETAEKKKGDKE
jgi:hypothetical protein